MPSLLYIGQQLNIYVGFFFLVTGLLGNGMNIYIFSSDRTYRNNPSTFYFLIGSIDNLIYLVINLITRIVSAGFGVDLVNTLLIWCQIRAYIVGSFSPISFTCSCLAIIDQFLRTSQNANLRLRTNMKSARRIVITIIIIWCLHGIPVFIFYRIPPIVYACSSINSVYAIYAAIFVSIFLCAAPVIVMIIFGYLTYRNIRLTIRLAQQHVDRQVTRMTLIQVLIVVIGMTPAGIFGTYLYITAGVEKDRDRQIKETFVNIITIMMSYFYYVVCLFFSLLDELNLSIVYLGKFLHVLHFVKSISSISQRTNLLLVNTSLTYSSLDQQEKYTNNLLMFFIVPIVIKIYCII
jgi:hypothetical protein